MKYAVEGIYRNGVVELQEDAPVNKTTKVIVLFKEEIKNFLHLDYPCGKTTGYYAKVMLLRSTGNFLYTLQGHPVASHREFSS